MSVFVKGRFTFTLSLRKQGNSDGENGLAWLCVRNRSLIVSCVRATLPCINLAYIVTMRRLMILKHPEMEMGFGSFPDKSLYSSRRLLPNK
uniref:Ovule protein n=1 Tax=Heterorhabditis bacteriophora TaxID=37862 RepID=A0A1I7X2E0_HETBA